MSIAEILFVLIAAVGHAVLWSSFVNRVHAWAVPRWIIKSLTVVAGILLALIPILVAADYYSRSQTELKLSASRGATIAYLVFCALLACYAVAEHFRWAKTSRPPKALLVNHTSTVDIAAVVGRRPLASGIPALLGRLPGNQVLKLSVQHKQLRIDRLPPEQDGLRIAHLSDLHICGRIERPFFEVVVAKTNDWQPDIVVITGDLFDRDRCLDWGIDVLSKLDAKCGVYFVFGNHDLLVDHDRSKRMLVEAGLHYLGGSWRSIDVRGKPIILAGNELPWFPPAADVESIPAAQNGDRPIRVLLAHAPDQFDWAVARDFDLALAGHTHGGQIRFPIVGAVASPSRHGTKYAAGTFQRDGTLMHVSRGTASLAPLRWNCPPELALLELRSGEVDAIAG